MIRLDTAGFGAGPYCSLTTGALGCANSFTGGKLAYSDSQIVSLPLDGSAPTQPPVDVTLPKLSKGANVYVVPILTTTRIGWTFELDPDDDFAGPYPQKRLRSVATATPGGHHLTSTFTIPDRQNYDVALAHGGDTLYVLHPAAPGIYTVSPDDRTQKIFLRP